MNQSLAPVTDPAIKAKLAFLYTARAYAQYLQDVEINTKWIELNNLYLSVERGEVCLTRSIVNQLETLAYVVSEKDWTLEGYWSREFQKLPNWFRF